MHGSALEVQPGQPAEHQNAQGPGLEGQPDQAGHDGDTGPVHRAVSSSRRTAAAGASTPKAAPADPNAAKAKAEHDGMIWLMDHGISIDNVIYYNHTGKFSFGWRTPLAKDVVSRILDVISEFPFAYEIKCDDKRTLTKE
mgnify:CR=1 FL=1